MNEIGNKIKELRKLKGLSQEELAETAKVNIRTIQRIENNESEPRGKTLHLICDVLELRVEDILDYGKKIDSQYLVFFHLSALIFLVIPIGNIIIPMILWMTKKDKIIGLKKIGVNLLNFQICWSILFFITVIVFTLLKINKQESFKVFSYLFISLYLLNIMLPIVFAIKSKNGKTEILYPSIIKFIK